MNDLISSSHQEPVKRPEKFEERFLLKRIGEEDIEITLAQRNALIEALGSSSRFIQINKHTIMVNAIKSIDPLWGEENIPPRPRPKDYYLEEYNRDPENDTEGREWDKVFGKVSLLSILQEHKSSSEKAAKELEKKIT